MNGCSNVDGDSRDSPGGSGSGSGSNSSRAETGRRRGTCKWFNVAKGWGFISPDDGGSDVFVHQSVIQMSGFRSLGDGEEVEFECKATGKGLEATRVTGPKGSACVGSNRRPLSKKRFRKFRCYNCGEFANHLAAKCGLGPQPKRCHFCKSDSHLIADCPDRPEDRRESDPARSASVNGTNGLNGSQSSHEPKQTNETTGDASQNESETSSHWSPSDTKSEAQT